MKLEQQVCSLELSKKLKELGIKQESLFWWILLPGGSYGITDSWERKIQPTERDYSAFTVAELGEMLPDYFHSYKCGVDWFIKDETPPNIKAGHYVYADTEADARAKMLIYLLENKLITL